MKNDLAHDQNGRQHIRVAFEAIGPSRRAALMPYFTLGYPDRETSLAVIQAIAPFSDLLELGVPFSDPIADGPTIQRSTQLALENGMTTAGCIEALAELRRRGVSTPVLLMGYYNPILAYGEARYVRDAAAVGADGLIIPDLPPEEAQELESLADEANLALIYFLAPTSNPQRIATVSERANGFIYLVSLTGITGARTGLAEGLADFVGRVRVGTGLPLAVGFGISTPEQVATVGAIADGVIVGSALINAVDQAGTETATVEEAVKEKAAAAARFVRTLAQALRES